MSESDHRPGVDLFCGGEWGWTKPTVNYDSLNPGGKHTSQKELSFSALSDMMVLEQRIGLFCPKKSAQYYTLYSETSTLYPVLYPVPRNQHPFQLLYSGFSLIQKALLSLQKVGI